MANCYDFFFRVRDDRNNFVAFVVGLDLADFLAVDSFDCDSGDSFGVTIGTKSSDLPGPDDFYDVPDTADETAAFALFDEAIAAKFPTVYAKRC
jgi:hypothetical protein